MICADMWIQLNSELITAGLKHKFKTLQSLYSLCCSYNYKPNETRRQEGKRQQISLPWPCKSAVNTVLVVVIVSSERHLSKQTK